MDIPYEDAQVLFVNKPAGMLSQKAAREDVSLVEYLTGYLQEKEKAGRRKRRYFPSWHLQPAGPEYQRPGGGRKDGEGASGSVRGLPGKDYA